MWGKSTPTTLPEGVVGFPNKAHFKGWDSSCQECLGPRGTYQCLALLQTTWFKVAHAWNMKGKSPALFPHFF